MARTSRDPSYDYLCMFARHPHIYAGPHKGTTFGSVEEAEAATTYAEGKNAEYHGTPLSHATCPRHARSYVQAYLRSRRNKGEQSS